MKKQFFQGVLCVLANILFAIIFMAVMFKFLHLPGGDLLLFIVTPAMMTALSLCLYIYVGKYRALKAFEGEKKPYASFLLKVEMIAFNTLAIFGVAIIFRFCHLPGAVDLLTLSCFTLAILSLLAGFGTCKLLKNK